MPRFRTGAAIAGLTLVAIAFTFPSIVRAVEADHASDIQLFTPIEVPTLAPAGVTPVSPQDALDTALVGRWSLWIPSVRLQNGSIGYGASMGTLTIDPDGRYTWQSHGRPLATGVVREVTPNRDAQAGKTYWLVSNGEEDFYLTADGDGIAVYDVTSNSFAARGKQS